MSTKQKCFDQLVLLYIGIPNLYVVETVDSVKKANTINKACDGLRSDPLRVYVQVNTSNEEGNNDNNTNNNNDSQMGTYPAHLFTLY